jgi:hypothetical protein
LVAQQNLESVRRVLWPRLWLQVASYVGLAVGAITLGPALVRFIGSDKEMLPLAWMILMATNGLLDAHCSVWNTLISLWNHLPMLWPSLATNAVALALNVVLVHLPDATPGVLILGPFLASLALNYWFWPNYGARALKLNWFEFLLSGLRSRHPAT